MGEDDERRRRRKKRVTLTWGGEPLRLPGEDHLRQTLDESTELALPDAADDLPAAPDTQLDGDQPAGPDAWERQRPRLTPPPIRRVSEPPASGSELPGEGDALSLVERRSRPSSPGIDMATEMHERFALGDYTAALRIAELLLGREPEQPDAQEISRASRERLASLYGSRLGRLTRVPRITVEGSDVRWLGLDHRAAFLLSRVDGAHTLEELIDVSGMPRLEALKTLVALLDLGAIDLPE